MSFPTRPRNLSQGSHHLAAWSPATFSPSQSIPSALWTSRPDRRTPAPSQLPWPSPSRRKYRGRCRVGLMSLSGCHHIFFSVFFLLWPPPAHIATTACRGPAAARDLAVTRSPAVPRDLTATRAQDGGGNQKSGGHGAQGTFSPLLHGDGILGVMDGIWNFGRYWARDSFLTCFVFFLFRLSIESSFPE